MHELKIIQYELHIHSHSQITHTHPHGLTDAVKPTHMSPEISTLKPHQQTLEMMTFRQIQRFC